MRQRTAPLLLGLGLLFAQSCGACTAEPEAGSGGSDAGGASPDAHADAPSGGGAKNDGASGGAPTGGGTGGTGGDPDLPADQAWLADPEIWQPVPGTEFTQPSCTVFEAAGDKLGFQKLVWEKCEPACEAADLVQGYGGATALPTASTHVVVGGTRPFLTMEHAVKTAKIIYKLRRTIRLEDGITLAAIQGRVLPSSTFLTCVFGNGRESARANALMGGEPGMELRMLAPLSGGKWIWSIPAKLQASLPPGLVEFDIDASGGAIFTTGKGKVAALLDPSKNDWTSLESPSTSRNGSGEGDLAAWTDYPSAGPERIRGWATDGKGVRTLIDPAPIDTCAIAVSPTSIVGLALEDGNGCTGFPLSTKARLWKSPRAYDQSGANVTLGTDFPGGPFQASGTVALRSWGDYAAALLNQYDDAGAFARVYLMITQLSTGKLWRLEAQTGRELHQDGWTFTPTHLYVGDREAKAGPFTVQRIVRIELSKLDQAATALN